MIGLTPKQAELLAFIEAWQEANPDRAPSYEEMAQGVGLVSRSNTHRLMQQLIDRGFIRRIPYRARAFEVVRNDIPDLSCIPLSVLQAEIERRAA